MAKEKKEKNPHQQLAKALAHPLRLKILTILNTKIASPNQISLELREPLGNVSYHVKTLLGYDCIELVKTVPRRGAVEHFYRAKPHAAVGSREWQKVPKSLRGDVTAAALDDLTTRGIEAIESGTFQSRDDSFLSTVIATVDEAGFLAIREILDDADRRATEVVQKCAGRLDDPAKGVPLVMAVAAFEAGGGDGKWAPPK